jgi:hypothetical protein
MADGDIKKTCGGKGQHIGNQVTGFTSQGFGDNPQAIFQQVERARRLSKISAAAPSPAVRVETCNI